MDKQSLAPVRCEGLFVLRGQIKHRNATYRIQNRYVNETKTDICNANSPKSKIIENEDEKVFSTNQKDYLTLQREVLGKK